MPRGRRFYDPFVEVAAPPSLTEAQPVPGLLVEKGGVYLHVEDIAAALRQMADEIAARTDVSAQDALLLAANSFAGVFVKDT